MSDANPNPDPSQQPAPSGADLRSVFEAKQAEADRTIAMLRAGVDDTSPFGSMFAAGYQGDLSPDAIKAAYTAAIESVRGPAPEPAPVAEEPPAPPATQPTPAERQAASDIVDLSTGAHLPGSHEDTPHPGVQAVTNYWADRKNGVPIEEAQAKAIDHVLASAYVDNDPRVVLAGGRKGGE